MHDHIDTVIVGGGQAGLATGYFLARRGLDFLILERHLRVGDSWRQRWDGLRLFTPARLDGLPGKPFPGPGQRYPTKDEVADYLEAYAQESGLPLHLGVDVQRLSATSDGRFEVATDAGVVHAERVVVASGAWHTPRVPEFAAGLSETILQLHSSEFRSVSTLREGPVLVIGGANSGAEIAALVAPAHETWLAGRDVGEMPFDIDGPVAPIVDRFIWFMANRVLTLANPLGRRARAVSLRGTPLERVRKRDLAAAGVRRITLRVEGARDGLPLLADGRTLSVANVIWATGFRHDYPWIELGVPVVGEDGWPLHERGVSTAVKGLFFVGLPFQHSLASPLLGGVGRDARHVADRVAADALAQAPLPAAV